MSTRATYEFNWLQCGKQCRTTFYIHHDGYPEGAAAYIYRSMCSGCHGGLPERFLRENGRAEFTNSHSIHGDTEYRYTITINAPFSESTVDVYAIRRGSRGGEKWFLADSCRIGEFIERSRARNPEVFDSVSGLPFSAFRLVRICWSDYYINQPIASDMLAEILATLKKWGNPETGNYQSELGRARAIVREFPALAFDEGELLCGGV